MQCRGSQPPPELHYGAEQGTPPRCTAALQLRAASCAHEGVHFCTHVCAVPQELKRACTHTASSAPKAVGAPAARLCPRGEEGLRGAGRGSRPGRGRTRPPTPQREKDKAAGGGRAATLTPDSPPHTPLCPRDGTTGRGGMSTPGRGAVGGNEERLTAGGLRAPHPRSAALPAPHRDGVRGKPRRGRSRSQRGGGGGKDGDGAPPPRSHNSARRERPPSEAGEAPRPPPPPSRPTGPAGSHRAGAAPAGDSARGPPCPDLPRAPGLGGPGTPRPGAASPTAGAAGHPYGTAPRSAAGTDAGGPADGAVPAAGCGRRSAVPAVPPLRPADGAAPLRPQRWGPQPRRSSVPPSALSFPSPQLFINRSAGGWGAAPAGDTPTPPLPPSPVLQHSQRTMEALPHRHGAPQRTASPALRHRDPLCQPPPTPPDPHTHWQARACCSR